MFANFDQIIGYVAAALVFCTFCMRTMLPLRLVGIASNVAFLSYSLPQHVWPLAILHGLLLPLNIMRLLEIRRMLGQVRAARSGAIDPKAFLSSLRHERHKKGETIFRKGEPGDCAYYIATGEIAFPEVGVTISSGQFFGEFSLFTEGHTRTASAVCESDVEIYRLDEEAVVIAFHQRPEFAFALVRLIVERMGSNTDRLGSEVAALQQRLAALSGPAAITPSAPAI
jgi:hypothetical protein